MKTYIFDWKRTLYDPKDKKLIGGAIEILDLLKQYDTKLILVGKGSDGMYSEVSRLGVNDYFNDIRFSEGAKDAKLYKDYIDASNPKATIFVGDRVRSELEIGSNLGATTIWIRQGKFANEEPVTLDQKPDYIVKSLMELLEIIKI